MFRHACFLCKIITIVAIIGALNWGLVGLAGYNLVDELFGVGSVAARIIYSLVGLSGLGLLAGFFMDCPVCNKGPLDKY
ncbi:MAG: DUF378 domain-containing protein [Parachlamydiaceae bacterium]|nr:DUF378 domain-containing protein [Parachlamydiaceae bacterium]